MDVWASKYQYAAAYSNNVVYQWRFEEPIQFNVVVLNDILQQHKR